LSCFGALVKNNNVSSYNLLINSESGAGKDFVTSKITEILPIERIIKRTRISPKVWTYWNRTRMRDDSFTWDGLIFYGEDLSNSVFNDECFKTMSSSGTHATVVINQAAIDIEIRGKPVMLITSASANLTAEMLRRFTILNLNETKEQTKLIMRKKADDATFGKTNKYNETIKNAICQLKRVSVVIKFASLFVDKFPEDSLIMRTHFDRFMDYIRSSAALYQYQRKKDSKGRVISTGEDYDNARDVLIKTTSNQYMIPLTKDQKKILKAIGSLNIQRTSNQRDMNPDKDIDGFYTIHEISDKISFLDYKTLRNRLDDLTTAKCLIKDSIKLDFKPATSYKLQPIEKITIPTWYELNNSPNTPITEKTTITTNTPNTKSNWSKRSNCIENRGINKEKIHRKCSKCGEKLSCEFVDGKPVCFSCLTNGGIK